MLLDMDTPVLKMLLINGGTFIFDNKDIHLQSEFIFISNGGKFQIGTEHHISWVCPIESLVCTEITNEY